METADILSCISLLFAFFSFGISILLGFRDRAKTTEIEALKAENQSRHDFAEKWFCSPIQGYLTSFQNCIMLAVQAMHLTDEDQRQQAFTKISTENFIIIFDDMDIFCDNRGDAAVAEIRQHLSDFMDGFTECIEEARKTISSENLIEKRRELLDIFHRFNAAVYVTLLAELNALKNAPKR